MDKTKIISLVVVVLLAIGGAIMKVDLKGMVCGAPVAAEAAK